MKEVEKNELMGVEGGMHTIMWYLGYAYSKAEGMSTGSSTEMWLNFI